MTCYNECERCAGYCCISGEGLRTPLTPDDIIRIAHHLRMPTGDFIDSFVALTKGRMQYGGNPQAVGHFKQIGPCPFLRQGSCGIQSVKPQSCCDAKLIRIDSRVSCAEWHKARRGWTSVEKTEKKKEPKEKEAIDIFPTCGEVVVGGTDGDDGGVLQ